MRVGAEWTSGVVKERGVTRLPWHEGSCENHLKPHRELESERMRHAVRPKGVEES